MRIRTVKGSQFLPLEAFISADRSGDGAYGCINGGDLVSCSYTVNNNNYTDRHGQKVYGLVLLAFVGLSGRLVWITRKNENKYQKQVLSQQGYSSTVIPYRRGNILDARGTRLATSEKVYNLVIDARVMTSKVKDEMKYLEPTLQALGEYF